MHKGYAAWATRWRVPLGFALGIAYLVFAHPTQRLLLIGSAGAFLGLALRALAAGYLDKGRILARGGPYAHTRNPLYLGSFIMGTGFALAGGSWVLGAAFFLLLVLVYWPVMRQEEEYLRDRFPEAYEVYAKTVPFFIPAWRPAASKSESFRWELYRKNREYEAALGYAGVLLFLGLKLSLR